MALQFKTKEAIEFGELKVAPELDAELTLRLRQTFDYATESEAAELTDLLASCFGDKKEEVKQFILNDMTFFDVRILHAYLLGGDKLVAMVMKEMDGGLNG